jgi:hypothetical protein
MKLLVIIVAFFISACSMKAPGDTMKLDGHKLFDEINNNGNHDG